MFLKQSTSQVVRIGPFLDKTDGVTPETGLTIANTGIKISKDGGAFANKNSGGATVDGSNGWYSATLDATDTNTVGVLEIEVTDSATHLPVWHTYYVVEEAIYDALFGASAAGFDANGRVDVGSWLGTEVTTSATSNKPEVDVNSISDDATAANNLELDYDGTGYNKANSTIGTTTTNTDMITAAAVNAEVDTALADINLDHLVGTATGIPAIPAGTFLDQIMDDGTATFDRTTDSLQAIRDRGDAAWTTGAGGSDRLLMVDTTIATLATQTSFTLTAGSADDDAYNNCTIIIEDVTTSTQKAVGMVLDYTGATKTVTLKEALAFTIATTDKVYILAENSLKSTVANRQLDVTATGAAGIDWGNVENPATAVDLSATDIQLCDTITTYTGNTPQTGDNYARLGAPAGASVSADLAAIKTDTAEILVDTNELQGDWTDGGRLDLIIDSILDDTGTTIPGTITTLQSDTDYIQTRLPAALVGGKMDSDATAISGSTDAADKLEASAETIETGVATGTPTTTTMAASALTEVTDDHYNGRIIIWTSGALLRQATDITDYDGGTKTFTFTAVTEAPAASDTFIIV